MVKKLSRIAALLAAGALLLGAIGCSDGGSSGGGGPSFTSRTADFNAADLAKEKGYEGVTSVSDEVTFDPEEIATATVAGTTITVTSVKAGTTTMTIKVSGEDFTDKPVEIKIKVAANGEISVVGEEPDTGGGSNDPVEISFGDMVVGPSENYTVAYDAAVHGKPTVTPSNSNFVLDVTIAHTATDKWNIKASSGTAGGKYAYTKTFSTQGGSYTTRRSVLLTLDTTKAYDITVYAKAGGASRYVAYYQCSETPTSKVDFGGAEATEGKQLKDQEVSQSSYDAVNFSVNGADGKYVYIGATNNIDIAYIVVSLKS